MSGVCRMDWFDGWSATMPTIGAFDIDWRRKSIGVDKTDWPRWFQRPASVIRNGGAVCTGDAVHKSWLTGHLETISRPARNHLGHPAEKPLSPARELIAKRPRKRSFDPFMGSGTTGVAAVAERRRLSGWRWTRAVRHSLPPYRGSLPPAPPIR